MRGHRAPAAGRWGPGFDGTAALAAVELPPEQTDGVDLFLRGMFGERHRVDIIRHIRRQRRRSLSVVDDNGQDVFRTITDFEKIPENRIIDAELAVSSEHIFSWSATVGPSRAQGETEETKLSF